MNKDKHPTTIAIDFDGTCVENNFPDIGADIGAAPVLKELISKGCKLILFTMRCNHDFNPESKDPRIKNIKGNFLDDAICWFKKNDIPLYGIQKDPNQETWTSSPKVFADIIIDDTAIGIPTIIKNNKYHVDWEAVRKILIDKKVL